MSRLQQPAFRWPTWQEIGASPALLRRVINVWPPYRCAGIRLEALASDWSRASVRLRLGPLSRNYVGTQFGGSLSSMVDPWWMLLLMHRLGPGYVVWDMQAQIDFVRPGRSDVRAEFVLGQDVVDEIRAQAAAGQKVLRWFNTDILDEDDQLVARARRQIYVRRKRPAH